MRSIRTKVGACSPWTLVTLNPGEATFIEEHRACLLRVRQGNNQLKRVQAQCSLFSIFVSKLAFKQGIKGTRAGAGKGKTLDVKYVEVCPG